MSTSQTYKRTASASQRLQDPLHTISRQEDRYATQTILSSLSLRFARIHYLSDLSSFQIRLCYASVCHMMREHPHGRVLTDEKGSILLDHLAKDVYIDAHRVELHPGDYVTISASRFPFANVMPEGRRSEDWVNSISRTLQWNSRQKQKAMQTWSKQETGESPAQ